MAAGWVIDHPAHARLLAPIMRDISNPNDVIIACDRKEVRQMIDHSDGYLPRRKTIWVPRPIGKGRYRKAWKRMKISKKALKNTEMVVSVGAPLELRAAPKTARRVYITDTEVNHLAHSLVKATDIIIPTHFCEEISGKLMTKKATFHRIDGLHGHIHLHPQIKPSTVSDPPKILVRELLGTGIHDENEILSIPDKWLLGLDIQRADENQIEGNPWDLDKRLASVDGVVTQSVTLASEAVLLGTPTLLVSKAKRGFLDRLVNDGYPLFIVREHDDKTYSEWLSGLHLLDALTIPDWPDTRSQLTEILISHTR
ncbi:MAG: hypothetical protein QGI21_02000 [Candidatus Poseidoniaceae archaeon]|jgi:hypothetical protein|nr:hypothetical protein [Candidatus Poseidoniaceae archaeon]